MKTMMLFDRSAEAGTIRPAFARRAALTLFLAASSGCAFAEGPPPEVVINGQALGAAEHRELAAVLGYTIPAGRYWYDPLIGAWGHEGSGTAGWIMPGLPVSASLPADASGRWRNQVWVNGRQLHPDELRQLSECTAIPPGRYWLRWDGWGGMEEMPASFNLRDLCAPSVSKAGTGSGLLSHGSVMGDGQGFGFIDSEGRSAHGGW